MNRQNRGNHHPNNQSSVNFDVINAAPLPPPPPIPGSLTDPSNFPIIPNLMDLFLRRNGQLQNPTTIDSTNTETTPSTTSQSSSPVQRFEI
jgi:hypothetical protein